MNQLLRLVPVLALASCTALLGGCVAPSDDGSEEGNLGESQDAIGVADIHVSTTGSDSASGGASSPFKTIHKALSTVRPGGKVLVHGGTYVENVSVSAARGTATAPIAVSAFGTEVPIIKGLLWLSNADYWTLSSINVTWNPANSASEHMVKMSGGKNWRITASEIWGAHSFAGLLVSGGATGFTVDHSRIHHTYKSNDVNQDHLIYVNQADGGTIERNELWESPNGRAIKIGNVGGSTSLPRNIVVRYNTMYRNLGPSNVQVSYAANGNEVYRNILMGSSAQNVTQQSLSGKNNVAHDNVGFGSSAVVQAGGGLADGGGNLHVDPLFVNALAADFHTQNAAVASYGRFAP